VIPVPAALAAHLDDTTTTLCHCWLLTRRDGMTLGFTDHDRALMVGTVNCEPASGFNAGEAEAALGLEIGTDVIEGALSSTRVDGTDLAAGLYDGAEISTLLVNWSEPDQRVVLRVATIARIEQADCAWRAEIEDLAADLGVPRGRLVRRHCDAELGDARCGVDLTSGGRRANGSVLERRGPFEIAVSGLGMAPQGRFNGGRLEWTSGARAGDSAEVRMHMRAGSDVSLLTRTPLPDAIAAGDDFTITIGCDKRFQTCKAVFANAVNFRGFPHLPGNDAAYTYAHQNITADGGPVVP
jgi:uncharacterized phage protein (TIGR02218 family)